MATPKQQIKKFQISFKNAWQAYIILVAGFILTYFATIYMHKDAEKEARKEFEFICNDLKTGIDARLKAHAQLLRSGSAFFAASDSVSRMEWKKFNESLKINRNLPGIQGIGYALIVPKLQKEQHIRFIKNIGFPNYSIYPEGERELYTPIIYLEPFSGRNIIAIGYDMYSDPIRRKAMEIARDLDIAMLSGKVLLVQETIKDKQAGTLMYVPVYKNEMPIKTVEQRRKAIKGWVYSPYRMNDLMTHIMGNWDIKDKNPISLQIYDGDSITEKNLLYNSQDFGNHSIIYRSNLNYQIPIVFNGKRWTLSFSQFNEKLSFSQGKVLIVLISGIIISILLYAISIALINTRQWAKHIQLLNSQLEKLNSDKDQFISVLAHDLRNPFNTLLGFSDLLINNLRNYKIEQIEIQVNAIYKTAKQTFNLLNDLLIWARSQAGKLHFDPQNLKLSVIIDEVLDTTQILAEAKKIEIKYLSIGEISVFADSNMLKTILRNLISNAIKYTNLGGNVEIYSEQETNDVLIKVSDNGIGIRPEIVKNLFENSKNSSTIGTNAEKGTGWGLMLCKEFIEKHSGKIWVESEPGKGSDFYFTLPGKALD